MTTSTIQSTIKGKAYEYACVLALREIVSSIRPIKIIENNSLEIAKSRYENDISQDEQSEMLLSAKSGIRAIIEMEPKITEDGVDQLSVLLQPDSIATSLGDIRDVLIIRRDIQWEIGVSVKHNHAALKHSRLSAKLDFGESWVGIPCSQTYFSEIEPIFDFLKIEKNKKTAWSALQSKEDSVYIPILNAFKKEFENINNSNKDITAKLIKYLIGSNGRDYYKLIHNNNRTTTVIPFNLYGTLNQAIRANKPKTIIPMISLPTRIIDLSLKKNSKTTLVLVMDKGWSISFRIHNASTVVEPSLKFDIQIVGQPANLFYLNVNW